MFKVNNKDTRKTPFNFEHISHIFSYIVNSTKKVKLWNIKDQNRLKVLHKFYYLYFGHTGWSHFQIAQSTTQIRHLIQFHVNGVFSFFEQTFPRICLNKVPLSLFNTFILSIPDYHHINFQWFLDFPIIMAVFHGESFRV